MVPKEAALSSSSLIFISIRSPRAADWPLEYTFTRAYRQLHYSPDAVKTVWKAMSNDRAVQDAYRRLYNVGRSELAGTLTAYFRAIGHLETSARLGRNVA